MSEKKYSVTIVAKSGDEVLTRAVYPDLTYAKLVETQAVIVGGLIGAGIEKALAQGEEIGEALMKRFGVSGA